MTGGDVWSARMRMVDAVLAPFNAVTLGQVFDRVVEECPRHRVFIFGNRQVSYLEFARLVAQAERGLWRLGVRQGEHVALVMPNSPERRRTRSPIDDHPRPSASKQEACTSWRPPRYRLPL